MPRTPKNIYETIFGDADTQGDTSVAAIDLGRQGESISYAQLKRAVDAVRTTTGIRAGENVALVMPNSPELIVGLLATWAQGAATAPLNPSYTAVEFKDLFDDLHTETVLILPGDEKLKADLKVASADLNIVEIDVKRSTTSEVSPPPTNLDNGVALYLHTSGTTGKPKAVPLRHSNLIRGTKNVAETYNLTSKDRTYLLQVLFHIHGIVAALIGPLTTGGSIVVPAGGKLDASCAWADFNKQAYTWVTGTPSILQTLLAAPADPLPKIRFMRSCSSPLLPTVFNALHERSKCPIIEAYAMTEASHQMCNNRLDSFSSGTVGPESGTTKVCIWGGSDQACQLGEEGEVSVCGENVMDGYEGVSLEKNNEAFWHGSDERGHEARWFKTGDRGILSTDGKRQLTLIGRLSEMVNRGGEKISPVEVDEAMMLVHDVKEAASFSVHDEFYGQESEAAVVLADGSKLDEASLQGLLENRLAKFKIPKRIHFCEGTIPKGPTGKIQRQNLSQKFASDGPEVPVHRKSTDIDVYGLIDRSLNLQSGKAESQPKATLLELGADSLGLAKIVSSLKRSHGRQLDTGTMFSFPSVETVVKMASQGIGSNHNQDEAPPEPAAFSLLPNGKDDLQKICDQAGVQPSDVEDAFPLSASQKMYFDIFLGDHKDTDMMWQMNRYRMTKGTDQKRLVQALKKLQEHEESLRWVLAEDPKLGRVTLQLSPAATASCVEQLEYATDEEAKEAVEIRLASCKHHPGTRTAIIYVIKIREELEMTFIESHGFAEGQGRAQMFETLTQAYKNEAVDSYPSYTNFNHRYPAGSDPEHKLEFWEKEDAAMKHSDGADWDLKQKVLENPPALTKDRLDLLGGERSVEAPFNKLTVQTGTTIPFIAEAVYALSLALYFGQQDPAFLRGSVVYDRCISLRTADPQFSGVRPVTGGYHPNSVLLAVAQHSLWAHFQTFKSITQLREQQVCVNNTVDIANHSAAFTWRFHDDEHEQQSETGSDPSQLIAGVKSEKAAFRAFKMCYVNGNRKGDNGVTIAIGFHQKWIEDQRRQGSRIELIDVYCDALKFCADNNADLHKLSLADLQKAIMK